MAKISILVLSGGVSSEHGVSLKTGQMVYDELDRDKYKVEKAVISQSGKWLFSFRDGECDIISALDILAKSDFDIVFIALHGEFGEDGKIQKLFDKIGQKYTGSGKDASALGLDKDLSNKRFKEIGLSVPLYKIISRESIADIDNLNFPLVVKPLKGGSSIGISIVNDQAELNDALDKAFDLEVQAMVQQFIAGREFTCGVIEQENKRPVPLPPTEIIPISSNFWDYEGKYEGGSKEVTPPNLPEDKIKEIRDIVIRVHKAFNCKGVSRTDLILRDDVFYVIEINTLPGMTSTSIVPQEAQAMGIGFSELLDLIINASL